MFVVVIYDYSYTLFFRLNNTNLWFSGLGESQWVWRHGFYSFRLLKLCAAAWPFCVALSHLVDWQTSIYVAALSINLEFVSGTCGPDSATCAGQVLAWRMGSDYSYCTDPELFDWQMYFLNRWKYISNAQESRPTLLFNCLPVPVVMLVFLLKLVDPAFCNKHFTLTEFLIDSILHVRDVRSIKDCTWVTWPEYASWQ